MKRVRWWFASAIFSFFMVVLLGCVIQFYRDAHNIPSGHSIGNRESNVKALKEKGFPFSFLVVSDTHNSERADMLIRAALKEKDASFMIHVGDFVTHPSLWDHRLFLSTMAGDIKPPFPVFLAPGNHDIDYTSSINDRRERMTPEIFESFYGPRNFDLTFNQCLFILCGVDPRNPRAYLDSLRDTLSKKGSGKKYIFVFRHYPLKGFVEYDGGLSNEEEFFSLLQSYRVTTCFSGHYHGYRRRERKGVNLVILGSGGGRFHSWQREWGKFHHLLKVTVDEDQVTEDMLVLQREPKNLIRTFRKWCFISLFPNLRNRGWVLYGFFILVLCWGVSSVIIAVRHLRSRRGLFEKWV